MLQAKTTVKFWRKRHNVCPRDRQRKNIATIHLRMTPMTRHWPGLSGKPWMFCGQKERFIGGLTEKAGIMGSGGFLSPGFMSLFGEGNGKPLQYSRLENPMDGGAWWAAVHGSHRVGHD